MSRETLIHQRGLSKCKVTNLITKIDQVTEKQDKSDLDEIHILDAQFQKQHLEASALVEPSNQELIQRDFEELEAHDD